VGFQKIAELKRNMPGRASAVSQMVYTDGLATLSIFVEPNASPPRAAEAASEDGTTAFFVRPVGEYVVSVLGEVPATTAQQIARSVVRRP
jgi:sigma-E factor negative regulatory protein RseB